MKISIKYAGNYLDFSGYGSANRNFIVALNSVGVDLTLQPISYTNEYDKMYGKEHDIVKELSGKNYPYDIKVIHIPCDGYLKYLEPCKYHIGHLFWETDKMSPEWVWNCNLMDEIWVGDHYHKEVFEKCGVKCPVWVFPQPIDVELPDKKFDTFFLSENGEEQNFDFIFYSVFQWIERKNPRMLLDAFWQEFRPNQGDKVALLLKTYKEYYSMDEQVRIIAEIKKWYAEFRLTSVCPVFIHCQLQDKNEVMMIHQTGDCFVLPHRGEGWSRCIAEAMLMGKPVIATNFGGIHDWIPKETYYPLDFKMAHVFNMDFAPHYRKDQQWAEPNVKSLRKMMRQVYEKRDEAKQVAKLGQDYIKRNFSYETVGRMLKDRLIDIQKQINRERESGIRWLDY